MSKVKSTSVEVRLPSQLGYEKVAMSTAAAVAKLMGFREDRVEDLKTAVAEACINAIEHGNKLNEDLSVGVVLSAGINALEVKVIDDGKGLKTLPPKPDIDKKIHGEEDPRGMGMFLIQALVDEAEWVKGSNGKSSYVRLVIRLDAVKRINTGEQRRHEIVQSETKARVDQLTSPAGHPVTALRFEGDIASTSKEAVLGSYQALPKETAKLVLLDFTKVDYINSSGIALVIQMLIEAANSGQKVYAFGLSPHFTKVFTMVGITKYAGLFPTQADALAAL